MSSCRGCNAQLTLSSGFSSGASALSFSFVPFCTGAGTAAPPALPAEVEDVSGNVQHGRLSQVRHV
jgi:hypothetical protein